jgi:hypothetical protein
LRIFSMLPSPRQVGQGVVITLPAPRHCPHVLATVKNPCWYRNWPVPRHCGHGVGDVPGAAPLP